MRTLLSLSVAVLAGLLMTRVAKPLKLPSVTAYLVAGVLIGPYCLGLLGIEGLGFPTQEAVDSLSLISEVALGFIAFSIGSEFRVSELRHTGKQAFVIGVLQALAATFLIDIALVAIALVTNGKLTIAELIYAREPAARISASVETLEPPKVFWKYYDLYRRKRISLSEYAAATGLSAFAIRHFLKNVVEKRPKTIEKPKQI